MKDFKGFIIISENLTGGNELHIHKKAMIFLELFTFFNETYDKERFLNLQLSK